MKPEVHKYGMCPPCADNRCDVCRAPCGCEHHDRRLADAVVTVLGALDDMRRFGLVEGGIRKLSEKGRVRYETLTKSGFQPTENEIDEVMATLQNEGGEPEDGDVGKNEGERKVS